MSRSVCVITETDEITRHEYTPTNVKFKVEGSKKPDTLVSHFTINNKVRENYEIAYIQDIISVEYLACIHNFQLSALDDRGYNLDGEVSASVNIPEARFLDVTSGRFKGNYALDLTAVNQEVQVPNAKAITRIDLSGQFDIYVFFTPDQIDPSLSGNNPIIWSFSDGSRGLEIGITNTSPVADTRGFVRAGNGIIDSITGTTESIITGAPVLIRVFRGGDNIVHMEVNGVEDGTPLTKTGSMQPTGPNLIFGNGRGLNDDYKGQIHQERTYIGTVLTQTQADTIRQSRPALFTMKFAGLVWDLQDKESYKIAKCDSHSKLLVKRKLSADIFPANDNVFGLQEGGGETFQEIFQDIVDATGSGFTVKAKDAFTSTTTTALLGNLIAIGSFLDVVSMLLLFSDTTFYVTPRKLLIVETNVGHSTDFTFDQDSDIVPYDITESGENDTTKVNEVILTGDGLTTARAFVAVVGTDITLRKFIRQLDNTTDLDTLAIELRDSLKDVNTKFIVRINVLVNWIRFNHIVTLNNTKKNITNDPFIVTQIEHEYPRSDSKIMVNENDIDFFDITNNDISTQEGLVDNTQ